MFRKRIPGRKDVRNWNAKLAEKGWWHSFVFPGGEVIDGVNTIEEQQHRLAQFPVPNNVTGKRVLDIGAWDGWFSFEMERRGAEVVAVDCWDNERFRYARKKLNSNVDYRVIDLYELSPSGIGYFDIVLFFGVLYHLKHPILALEKVCALTREVALVESYVIDEGKVRKRGENTFPMMEFYETDELSGQLDNWIGPDCRCLLALCRTAGFARVSLESVIAQRAHVTCDRRWQTISKTVAYPPPVLTSVAHNSNGGVNFYTPRDEYVSCWFRCSERGLRGEHVLPEVSGYGVQPIYVGQKEPGLWQANFKLPPGLAPGWHEVRIRTAGSTFSNALKIAVDIPPRTTRVSITGICDGISWQPEHVQLRGPGVVSVWVSGLPENADVHNVRIELSGTPLQLEHLSPIGEASLRQINAKVPNWIGCGEHKLIVSLGDVRSEAVRVQVVSPTGS